MTTSSSSRSGEQEGDNQPNSRMRRREDVYNAALGLLNVIPTPVLKQEAEDAQEAVKAVIYFDEAHELSNYQVGPKQRNRLEVLYSCLDLFVRFPLMFIFTSTTLDLRPLLFPSPQVMVPSARRVIKAPVDHAPITELPFDCHYSFPLKSNNYSFEEICEVKFLANFGRPLFWSLLENGGTAEQVLRLAKDKLAPLESKLIYDSPVSLSLPPTYSFTAIIDILLMLDYNPYRQMVKHMQKELAANHMRTLISIPHRESIRSCYTSEPLLAEAAMAKLAQELDVTGPDCVIDMVNAHFSEDLLRSGDLGELAARMLLMDAYINACKQGSKGKQVIYSEGCKLKDFLHCLFHESNQVLEAKPDNVHDGPTLKEAFQDAVVRFTHFGDFIDGTTTSQYLAHSAFLRCTAIICQDYVNILIPVLSTTKGVVCPHVITSILIQVKRRVCPGNPRLFPVNQAKVGFFPENTMCECGTPPRRTELYLPYINVVLDFGARGRPTDLATSTSQITPAREPRVQVGASPERQPLPKHYPYTIYTRGLSGYRSITTQNASKYEQLLRSSSLLGDHLRQDPLHLTMIRELKPFWAGGVAFDWIENDALNACPAPTEGDALEVGKYEGEAEDEDDT